MNQFKDIILGNHPAKYNLLLPLAGGISRSLLRKEKGEKSHV